VFRVLSLKTDSLVIKSSSFFLKSLVIFAISIRTNVSRARVRCRESGSVLVGECRECKRVLTCRESNILGARPGSLRTKIRKLASHAFN